MIQINNKTCFSLDDILDSFSSDMLRLYTYPLLREKLHRTKGCEEIANEVDGLTETNQKFSDLLKFAHLIEVFFKKDTDKSIRILSNFINRKLDGMTMLNMKEQFKSLFTDDIDSRFFKERKYIYGNAFDNILCINDILTQNPDFYNDEVSFCKLYALLLEMEGQSNLAEEINGRIAHFETKQSYFDDSAFPDIDLRRLPRRNDKISICVLGNLFVGKTSLLASLFYTMKNYYKGDKFEFDDSSPQNESLKNKVEEMISEANLKLKNKVMLERGPSSLFWSYRLMSSMYDNRSIEMDFVDIPGSFFPLNGSHSFEIQERVNDSKVFIIVIDAPYLMEAMNPDNCLCSDSTNIAVNGVHDIQSYLTYINNNNGKDSILVMFVPVKCEKWLKEHRENEVMQRINDVYSATINSLKTFYKVAVKILPVETMGGVEYFEMKKSKICDPEKKEECCELDKNTIRYSDGTVRTKTKENMISDDPSCIVSGTHIMRPRSWFVVNNNIYCPRYCERIVYEIMKYACQ